MERVEEVDRRLSLMLSLPVLAMLTVVGSSIFMFPLLSKYEGHFFPVVTNVHVTEIETDLPTSVRVEVEFDKVRSCELVTLNWYNQVNQRVPVIFRLRDQTIAPVTLSTGDAQRSGPWDIVGVTSLEGTRAVAVHRCNPFYLTATDFYP
jgi:hypothetical protein